MRIKYTFPVLTLFFITLLFSSCGSPKDIAYLQDIDKILAESGRYDAASTAVIIKPNDNLFIKVSAINAEAAEIFNLIPPSVLSNTNSLSYQGYLVDEDGYINFPLIGAIKVAGLTKKDATELISSKVSNYISDPVVNIRFLNYKITVLGEVTNPGTYTISDEKISIFEAIGLAKDLTIYGKRENVIVYRNNNGKRESAQLNLNSAEIINSPYFYLQQNDVVYVEPNKAKSGSSTYSQNLPLIISAISTAITAAALIVNLSK